MRESDYAIIKGDINFVTNKVAEMTKEGWSPVGGVSHVYDSRIYGGYSYAQAMVKYEQES